MHGIFKTPNPNGLRVDLSTIFPYYDEIKQKCYSCANAKKADLQSHIVSLGKLTSIQQQCFSPYASSSVGGDQYVNHTG